MPGDGGAGSGSRPGGAPVGVELAELFASPEGMVDPETTAGFSLPTYPEQVQRSESCCLIHG